MYYSSITILTIVNEEEEDIYSEVKTRKQKSAAENSTSMSSSNNESGAPYKISSELEQMWTKKNEDLISAPNPYMDHRILLITSDEWSTRRSFPVFP